jgi:hypothetical protein
MNDLVLPLDSFEYEQKEILKFFNESYSDVLLKHKDQANHIGSFNIKQEFLEQSFPKLCNSIKKVVREDDTFFARFFITLPNSKGDIHIDTTKGSPTLYRNLTLNIPLTDCQGTFHEWYDTHQTPYTEFKHSALYWRNYDSGTLIDQYELTVPSILKVSIPHRIYNPLNTCRVILSVRTESDTFNLASDSTAKALQSEITLLRT